MTSPEVTENDVTETGNDSIGSDENVREIMFCAFFFSPGFCCFFFLRKHLGVYSEILGISHKNFARGNIDQ
jgi:hypothetical protein